jgi:hypothetical protein
MNSFSYLGNCGTFEIYYYKGETVKEKWVDWIKMFKISHLDSVYPKYILQRFSRILEIFKKVNHVLRLITSPIIIMQFTIA